MALIELRTLGTLDLHSAEGRELHSLLAQPKRVALLAYLCIAKPHGFHRRDTLLGLFWPDSDHEHARSSLRKSIHILRRSLGDDAILSRGDEEVAVDFRLVSCDAAAFEASVKANRLEEALERYGGDLLAGFFIDEAPEFEKWLQSERGRLRACAARASLGLSDQFAASGNITAAITWARRSFELSDTDERALQKLIDLQYRIGDRVGAIHTYETFAGRLAAEYQTEPSTDTRSLIERIRSGKETLGSGTEAKALVPTSDAQGRISPLPTIAVGPEAEKGKVGSRRARWMRFAATALAIGISAISIWAWTHPTPSKQVLRYTLAIDSTEAMIPATPFSGRVAISPDGSRFAYISGPDQQLLMRLRNELHATAIAGTAGAFHPFFSPDGKSVGFLRQKSIWIASLDGGPPIHVSDSLNGVAGASWGPDGFIYVDGFMSAPLARVEARGGAVPKWFTALDTLKGEMDHLWPHALPNGKGVLFTVGFTRRDTPNAGMTFAIAVAEVPSGKHRVIIENASYPLYVLSGSLLYVTPNRKLMMVAFDQNSMKVTSEPTTLLEGMRFSPYSATDLAISSTGTLVYSLGGEELSQFQQELLWVTRDGKMQPVDPNWHGIFEAPALSPDGKRLAISKMPDAVSGDIWIKHLDGGPAIRLTHGRIFDGGTTWTPDGRSVSFEGIPAGGNYDLWTQRADGSAEAVLQFRHGRNIFHPRWAPDGKWLIFQMLREGTQADVVGIRPGIDTTPVPLVAGKFFDVFGELSPDGRWLAYQSDETGRFEIYVVPFPNTKTAKWAVSSRGGIHPLWSHRGDELFYRDTTGDFFAVGIKTTPTFSSARPRRLFEAKRPLYPFSGYAVSADDQRFLITRHLHAGSTDKLIVVENWFEELKSPGTTTSAASSASRVRSR